MFEKMMPGKKYPSIIANTDRSDEGGTHWWSILKISPKSKLLLFDSFGISGMRHFIVANDKKKNSWEGIKRPGASGSKGQ